MTARPTDSQTAIYLNLTPGFGTRSFRKALDRFKSLTGILEADDLSLAECGLSTETVTALRRGNAMDACGQEMTRARRLGARLVTWFDEDYPALLKHIPDPPPVLYVRGSLDISGPVSVAVVGSRRASPYGLRTAAAIGRGLAEAGFNVVSGMARGIDTAAHRGALEGGGPTVAVFGCGLDIIYPPENRKLAEEITLNGACVSEFPLGTHPDKYTFPRRNRIISGLSLGTVVVEAASKSGALITADHAMEQGRDVFAVPGPIGTGKSAGCHYLIRQGARLFESIEDVIEGLKPLYREKLKDGDGPRLPGENLTLEESTVLESIGDEPIFMDEVINHSGLAPEKCAALLLSLELKGCVRQFPGKRFIRSVSEV